MNELKVFDYEQNEIRTLEKDGETWWVLKDVCEVFGEQNYRRVSTRIDEDEKGVSQIDTLGGKQNMTIVNESGLYSTLFAMQPEKARGVNEEYILNRQDKLKKFKKWVTSEVLPSIRKNGGYISGQEELKPEELIAKALVVANSIIENQKKELEQKTKTLNILTHVKKLYTTTELAKEIEMKSAFELNKKLIDKKIQYRQNGTYVLYSKYSDLGYESIKQEVLDNGKVIYHRKWTQRGREFILNLLKGE